MSFLYLASRKKTTGEITHQRGFGLIELMVSISIMVIVAGIILSRQGAFNSAILLRGQAYEIAFKVREIQLSAVSASNDSDTSTFRSVLGLSFSADSAFDNQYAIFRDSSSGTYENFFDPGEEFGIQGVIDNRFAISAIRINEGRPLDGDMISVVFERPNFDAKFFDVSGEINATSIEIDIARVAAGPSPTGVENVRTLEISSTGQIGVN